MYKHPLFISWALLLVAIAVLDRVALVFFLYWVYPWFDLMIHFLGGVFVGLSALWFFFESGYVRVYKSTQNIVLVTIGSIVLIGIGWEIFEILIKTSTGEGFVFDTVTDLIMDGLGASFALFIFIKIYLTKEGKIKGIKEQKEHE